MFKCVFYTMSFLLFIAVSGRGEEAQRSFPPICPSETSNQLEQALTVLNMTWTDLTFEKDVATPTQVMTIARAVLQNPMTLPAFADQTRIALTADEPSAFWSWVGEQLNIPLQRDDTTIATNGIIHFSVELDVALSNALCRFTLAALEARALLDHSFSEITEEEQQYAAAAILFDLLDADAQPDVSKALIRAGMSELLLNRIRSESEALDPKPAMDRLLSIIGRVHFAPMMAAAQTMETELHELFAAAGAITNWPEAPLTIVTPAGILRIGTLNDDEYCEPCLLILDPGGNDRYFNTGGANGLLDRPLAFILDMAGNDFYDDMALIGGGGALWGLACCVDVEGNDIRRAAYSGQASGLFGVGLLTDRAGNDQYTAGTFAQSAAVAGASRLDDFAGNDLYSIACAGQAYAGVQGVAALIDRQGNEVYVAGRTRRDYERHWKNYLSLAQGFATGMRPFTGGGVAVLLDQAGNDTYTADVYAQGVGYWYAVGLLLDLDGHDTYRLHEYGQGCGVHLSAGLLADYGGRDSYTAYSLAQGAAHDYAVGMLFDHAGDDTFTADHFAQGRGINNALGFLIDTRGEDAYFARHPDACQGAGHFADVREYTSLSLLLDMADQDIYSCGASNGVNTLRPDHGLICDVATNLPLTSDLPADTMPAPDLSGWAPDELMTSACRFGNTEERRVIKEAAYQELKNRGAPALEYLLQNAAGDNMWYMIYADRMVREIPPDISAPALLHIAGISTNDLVRKYATFLLGFHETPEYADRIAGGLTNEITSGATIRTLGKWKITNAADRITPFLQNTNERKRIIAINALHDIGDTNALQSVIPLLHDPLFTVRQSAERALSSTNTMK